MKYTVDRLSIPTLNITWVLGSLLLLLCSANALAQQQGVPSRIRTEGPAGGQASNAGAALNAREGGGGGSGAEGVLAETRKDYRIAPGDVLEIWVEDAPELSRNYRVNASGEFPMNVVGRVNARAKTAEELGQAIAGRLSAEEYLNKPNVVVTVRQYNSQTYIVQGSVNKPGIYQLETQPDMYTLLGLAGGLSESHGSTAFILRSKNRAASDNAGAANEPENPAAEAAAAKEPAAAKATKPVEPSATAPKAESKAEADATDETQGAETSDKNYELIRVNLSALYKGRFDQNLLLEPQDIINIPRIDVFFVAGEVVAPGSFPLKDGTTLRQAISLAQGTTFKAKKGSGVIFREDPNTGKRQEIKVDVGAVMDGKQDDVAILPNDVVIVPNSRSKSISSALLTAFGTSAARIPIRY